MRQASPEDLQREPGGGEGMSYPVHGFSMRESN